MYNDKLLVQQQENTHTDIPPQAHGTVLIHCMCLTCFSLSLQMKALIIPHIYFLQAFIDMLGQNTQGW